jgi:general secretion pathway protein K
MMPAVESEGSAAAGFLLVAVLWILAALATLASIYSIYSLNTVNGSHVADDRVQAEASIQAGVEMAVFRELAVPDPARPSHGAFDLRVGRTRVSVAFRSEAARIDLNAAPADLLAGLFAAIGVDSKHAATFADRVVGWRTKADGNAPSKADANAPSNADANAPSNADANANANANIPSKEAQFYAAQGVRYPPRQAPFDSVLELSLLPGLPEPVVERVLPFLTVFSGRPGIDVVTADPTVLSALPGMTPEILSTVLKARAKDPGDGRALLELLGPAKSHAGTDRSKAVRAAVEVQFDNGRRIQAEVVFRLKDGGDEPYDLLYWRDDFDAPMQSG